MGGTFGRSSLEAAANGCAVIISYRGGLPEIIKNVIILKKLNSNEIYKEIEKLIVNTKLRKNLQNLSYRNFFLTHKFITNKLDQIRDEKLLSVKKLTFQILKDL